MVARQHEMCDACGFDGAGYDDATLLTALDDLGDRWRMLLADAGSDLRVRPSPEVWSAIEYAAHSRDITALHVYGVEQALTSEEPVLPAIAADELIESAASTYEDADADAVTTDLTEHASHLAAIADEAGIGAWSHGLTIGDERIDVRRLLEHALHDSSHHISDVTRGLSLLRA